MTFQALRTVEVEPKTYQTSLVTRDIDDLPAGDVLVRVHYSSINYKDALSLNGNKGVTRNYPHTPGIDAAGVVESSNTDQFKRGDEVIVTSYDLGMNTDGGYGEYIRVPEAWVMKKPAGLSLKESMVIGTAGLTAALSIDKLVQMNVQPEDGDILVTGATGGVGSIAINILSQLGYSVYAGTGKEDKADLLKALGAKDIVSREGLAAGADKSMLRPRWAGVVDTVGGDILFNAVKATLPGGSVTACGLAASATFDANVFPFILRGVNLLGVDSVEIDMAYRSRIWIKLASDWKPEGLGAITQEVELLKVSDVAKQFLSGTHFGRTLVTL